MGYSEVDRADIKDAIDRINPPSYRLRVRSVSSALPPLSRTPSPPRQRSETSSLSILSTPELEDFDGIYGGHGEQGAGAGKVCFFFYSQISLLHFIKLAILQLDAQPPAVEASPDEVEASPIEGRGSHLTFPVAVKWELGPDPEPPGGANTSAISDDDRLTHPASPLIPITAEVETRMVSLERQLLEKSEADRRDECRESETKRLYLHPIKPA